MNNIEKGNILVGAAIIIGLFLFLLTRSPKSILYGVPFVLLVLGIARWFGSPSKSTKGDFGFPLALSLVVGLVWLLEIVTKRFYGINIFGW